MTKYDQAYTHCPVCQGQEISPYHSDLRDNRIFICRSCRVLFMSPVYSDAHLDAYYSNYIPRSHDEGALAHQAFVTRDNFKAINAIVKGKGNFLDFGAGDGTHAKYAQEHGWNVIGYDVDPVAMEKIKTEIGIDVFYDDFFKVDWQGQRFKLIYANQVIEHLKDPARYLGAFSDLLKEDGYLFISVPNIHSTSNRIKCFMEKAKLRRHKIGKYFNSDHHLIYYNPVSIQNMLDLAGFETVYWRNCAKPPGKKSKLAHFIDHAIAEKFLSTSTFLLLAKKKSHHPI